MFTQVPNEILELMMRLPGARARMLAAIVRLTCGYHRNSTTVSLNELKNMTGMHRPNINRVLRLLEKDGIVSVSTSNGKHTITLTHVVNTTTPCNHHDYPVITTTTPCYHHDYTPVITTTTPYYHHDNTDNFSAQDKPNNSNTSHKQPKTLNKVLNKYINKDLNKGENKYLNKESGSSVKSTPETYKGVPVAQISNLYHKILSELPPISYWSKKRLYLLHQRWSEDPHRQNLNFWQSFFEKVRTSDFLMGKIKGKARNWRCNIDWLLDEEHFLKVCEGFYENKYSPGDILLTSKTSKNWEVVQMFEEAFSIIERRNSKDDSGK